MVGAAAGLPDFSGFAASARLALKASHASSGTFWTRAIPSSARISLSVGKGDLAAISAKKAGTGLSMDTSASGADSVMGNAGVSADSSPTAGRWWTSASSTPGSAV